MHGGGGQVTAVPQAPSRLLRGAALGVSSPIYQVVPAGGLEATCACVQRGWIMKEATSCVSQATAAAHGAVPPRGVEHPGAAAAVRRGRWRAREVHTVHTRASTRPPESTPLECTNGLLFIHGLKGGRCPSCRVNRPLPMRARAPRDEVCCRLWCPFDEVSEYQLAPHLGGQGGGGGADQIGRRAPRRSTRPRGVGRTTCPIKSARGRSVAAFA